MKNIFRLFLIAIFALPLSAKEPTNVLIGFGAGIGQTKLSEEHSQIMLDPIYNTFGSALRWNAMTNKQLTSSAVAYEFLLGYKHFINDFVGFRYYGNVGFQHYQAKSLGDNKQNLGLIDYTLNADLLIDFYENEYFAIGIVGGLGFGATSFYSKAMSKYMGIYSATDNNTVFVGEANVKKHFLNANASAGVRMAFFQKVRRTGARVCDKYVAGKRTCQVPVFYIGHNIEFNAKFILLDYLATPYPDIVADVGAGNPKSRPGYTVKNPYRLTVRYIIDF